MSCLLAVPTDEIVQRMVEDYFDIDNFGVKLVPPVAGSDDVRARRILEDAMVKLGLR